LLNLIIAEVCFGRQLRHPQAGWHLEPVWGSALPSVVHFLE
jgi:hypothetical protein